jgi:hypothetical protein
MILIYYLEIINGDPGWIRTTNLPLRRGLLYPVEPQSHIYILKKLIHLEKIKAL